MTKLWVDDLREPPDGWEWAKTSQDAINLLDYHSNGVPVEEMSLDHDLGGEDTTRPIILWLCEEDWLWWPEIRVHSANPVGREWLEGMIKRYRP